MKNQNLLRGLFAAAVLIVAPAKADQFTVDQASTTDTVFFRSTAKLEFIEGSTTDLEGGFKFNPDSASSPITGVLRVDLRTLKTGIDTRDRHMRENHLHTEDYPYAYFEFTGVSGLPAGLRSDSTFQGDVAGNFYIHGGKRRISATISFRWRTAADGHRELSGRADFAMDLDEFRIERPKALFLKLAETIEVEVILSARNDLKAEPIVLPDWPLIP
jgi:polyisoprenoid-binding protein YceI